MNALFSVQVAQPFGANIGGSSPHLFSMKRDSEWDSWLTVGPTTGEAPSALSSVGIDFAHWSESHGIHTGNTGGAVFWMDPNDGPTMEDNNGKVRLCLHHFYARIVNYSYIKSTVSDLSRIYADRAQIRLDTTDWSCSLRWGF